MPSARVSDLAEQIRGVSYGKDDASAAPRPGYLPVLRAGNISDDGLVFDDLVFVPAERIAEKQKIRRNDVVIAASSGSLDVVGKSARAVSDYDGAFGAFCKVLRPSSDVDPGYFAHYFRTATYRRKVSQLAAGININNIRNEHLDDLRVPLPPLAEQRRIAAILDKADSLRAKRRVVLTQLDTLTQAIFFDMFGDPISNPKRWPRQKICDVARILTGSTPSRKRPEHYGDTIEWIKSDNVNTPHYYLTRASEGLSELGRCVARIAPADSILVTCIAGSPDCIGNSAMADREVAFNQQINAIIPVEGNAHFIYGQLRAGKRLVQQASTASMKGMVSKSRFARIELVWPPESLQSRYAEHVLAVEHAIGKQRSSADSLDRLLVVLQHRAFRGEL